MATVGMPGGPGQFGNSGPGSDGQDEGGPKQVRKRKRPATTPAPPPPPPPPPPPTVSTSTRPATTRSVSTPSSTPTSATSTTNNNANNNNNAGAAATTPVRGVATLTPEQLARKRQNDREAQRAIRERTKTLIAQLQARIKQLEESDPQRELRAAVRAKEAVERENDRIRAEIGTVFPVLERVLERADRGRGGGDGAEGEEGYGYGHGHAEKEREGTSPGSAVSGRTATGGLGFAGYKSLTLESHGVGSGVHSVSAQTPNSAARPGTVVLSGTLPAPGGQQHQQHQQHLDQRLGLDFLLDDGQRLAASSVGIPDPVGMRLHVGPLFTPAGTAHKLEPPSCGIPPSIPLTATIPEHAVLPKHVSPTCPLDSILLNFLRERHMMAKQGVPPSVLVGPRYPNFGPLVEGCRAASGLPLSSSSSAASAGSPSGSSASPAPRPGPAVRAGSHQSAGYIHPLSKIFTDIIHTFPDLSRLPDQVAIVYVQFLLMRWKICPTRENYDALPEWIRPRPSQLFSPHPAWMDSVPWPLLRDRMVQMDPFVSFEVFFVPYTGDFSVNWPYPPEECLIPAPGVGGGSAGSANGAGRGYQSHSGQGHYHMPHPPTAYSPYHDSPSSSSPLSGSSSVLHPAFGSIHSHGHTHGQGHGHSFGPTSAPPDRVAASGPEQHQHQHQHQLYSHGPGSGAGADADGGGDPDALALLQGPWVLNPAFEAHLRDLSKWSLGSKFRRTFPDLVPLVRMS